VAAEPVVRERRLPVVVSDNHSTDDTVATVRALMREFPELDLRLYAQPESLGPIGNLAWLVEHAPPAEYLWWLGDDDLPTEGTVGAALDAIAAHAPALVHLPCEWREPDGRLSGASPCPEELERYATGRELLLTYYCLHFISASIVRRAELQEALHLAPTRNLWAPHIWFGVAARHAACVVLPRVGVVGGLDSTWLPQRVPLLTRGVVESFDAGLHLAVGEEDFARMLDIRYEPAQGNDEYWMAAPIEDLTGALERFPASRQLRRLALERTLRDGEPTAVAAAARAAARTGSAQCASELVAAGEACFARAELERAQQLFADAAAEDPSNVVAWCNLGVARHALGREDAREAFDAAAAVAPESVDPLHNRAMWHAAEGHALEAAADLGRLRELAPEHPATAVTAEVVRRLAAVA